MRCRIIFFFALSVWSLAAWASSPGYVYDRDGVPDGMSVVFNLQGGWFSFQRRDDVDLDISENEIGGALTDCSDEQYHCLSGAFDIAIPKSIKSDRWIYSAISCSVVARERISIYRIQCSSGRIDPYTIIYSPERGVLGIKQEHDDKTVSFHVRGMTGLFARYDAW